MDESPSMERGLFHFVFIELRLRNRSVFQTAYPRVVRDTHTEVTVTTRAWTYRVSSSLPHAGRFFPVSKIDELYSLSNYILSLLPQNIFILVQ